MKTKHLLTALALPAVFAACTAEDIVTESVSQAQRVALNENFKMNFGGVESRLDAGEPGEALSFNFEEGDMVGGAIIDQFYPASGNLTEEQYQAQYQVVDFVSANQPFTFDGSEWTINHTMVEGKYLFYYPYNEENNSRGAAKFSIPVMQELSDAKTGEFNPKAAVERYAMSVGYQFLSKDDLSASVELAPIFSYARIIAKIDNAFAGGEVEKIVLRAGSWTEGEGDAKVTKYDAFNLNGQLGNKKIVDIYTSLATDPKFDWKSYTATSQFALEATYTDEDDEDVANVYYDATINGSSPVMVGKVPAGVSLKSDAQGNKTFETYMVMPAQAMNAPIHVYLYTTDGRVFEGQVAKTTFNRNTPKKMEVPMTLSTAGELFVIASQANWNESVAQVTKDGATFIIADPNFTITNDMKYSDKGIINVDGNLTVSGDNVAMKNVNATTITVAEGAKLTTDVTLKATEIINKGTVVVAENAEDKDGKLVSYEIGTITNYNALNVNKDAVISIVLNNKKGAVVDNAGELTILSGSNYGTINNTAAVYVSGEFVNGAREYKVVDNESVLVNEPTIDNAATGSIRTNAAAAELKNESLLTNAGILSVANSEGAINNTADGVIDAKASSTTFIKENKGKIIVYSMKQADLSVKTQDGVIEYTATAADVTVDESIVTNIVATKDLEIKLADKSKTYKFNYLTTEASAAIKFTWATDATIPTIGLNVKAGKTIVNTSITVNELIIAEGASVSIPEKVVLTLDGAALTDGNNDCTNEGTISVVGKLVAKSYDGTKAVVGQYDDNGKGAFEWADTPLQVAYKEYVNAVEKLIDLWAVDTNIGDNEVSTLSYDLLKNEVALKASDKFAAYYTIRLNYEKGKNISGDAAVAKAVEAKLNAYNAKWIASATGNTEKAVTEGYAAAVAQFMTTVKQTDDYKAAVKDMKVTAKSENCFFVDDATTTTLDESNRDAVAKFKEWLLNSGVSLNKKYLSVLCSETAYSNVSTYVPDYTFAFKSSNVYKLFEEIICGGYTFGGLLMTVPTDNATLKAWVSNASSVADNEITPNKIARDYVNATAGTTTYAIYKESLKWNYSVATIAAMKAEAQSK